MEYCHTTGSDPRFVSRLKKKKKMFQFVIRSLQGTALLLKSDPIIQTASAPLSVFMFVFMNARKKKMCTGANRECLWMPLAAADEVVFRVLVGAAPRGGLPTHLIETLPIRESRHGMCVIWAHTHLHDCLFKSYILLDFICCSATVNLRPVIFYFFLHILDAYHKISLL